MLLPRLSVIIMCISLLAVLSFAAGAVAWVDLPESVGKEPMELEWNFPLVAWVNGYVQYFNEYVENLLDYNASSNRIGIGFMLKEW